jgi:Oxidoreductase family, C-terminal alpha/beta domain/Oxidoreductase family, NAD-binding Rossmann fold
MKNSTSTAREAINPPPSHSNKSNPQFTRRRFLSTTAKAGALLAAPLIIPGSVLGMDGGVVPSDKIVLGGIGIGNRGTYDLGCFLAEPDVQCVAVCDIQEAHRQAAKDKVDASNGNRDCAMYRDFRDLLARSDLDAVLIATGPNWHATAAIAAANAGKDVYCEKPCTKNIVQSLELAKAFHRTARVFQAGTERRSLPNFMFVVQLAQRGRLGTLKTLYAHPGGLATSMSGWAPAEPEPPKDKIDWNLYLGPAAWRPFNHKWLDGFNFEKGGGLVGGGCLEWGSHCVDLCQWANQADNTDPIEYEPVGDQLHARYANGVKLVMRDNGWLGLGSCPVRFEGDLGWVETGDDGDIAASSPSLLVGKGAKISGYPANFHIRNFLDCIKTRESTRANVDVACHSHIACHAANVALFLHREVKYDPKTTMFIGDEEANRLRSEALREPWRI